ncbi:hypothetical protein A2Z33_00955 [Candidatus Gottesmanbacteria bacterium RBG_16_52_11]|uniref:DUF4352 domain-containing protein n=1 Tax=Candidatus Gottesmanbacteria bacterium RBG_16_52_11 TaxID=1798374 RepID=A0A1F5YPJ1_9BACT|nr:MAG: hypothetical protein A2Z33_00955 [Candidatus Gottesmanbacteria bacterium RBG_16_52_11]
MKTITVSLPEIPEISINTIKKLTDSAVSFFADIADRVYPISAKRKLNLSALRKNPKFRKLFLVAVIVLAVVLIGSILTGRKAPAVSGTNDTRVTVAGPKASLQINKEFQFPLLDKNGKELTRLRYVIESAELRDEIIVKGQRAVAVKGRTFLIVTIKVINDYQKPIEITTRDYVRLMLDGNANELLAADIHNDPVLVQPISTKPTRIGFPVDDSAGSLSLIVGEIKGDKETIPLTF